MDSKDIEHLFKEAKARWEIIWLVAELEKENKRQKEELNFYYKAAKQFRKDKDVLMKENEELEKENKELKMKIDTLELCIKNKDELLEEYRKKIDKLRTDNIYEEWLYE